MIVDMLKAENRPSKGAIWGTAMASSAAEEAQGRLTLLSIIMDIRIAPRYTYWSQLRHLIVTRFHKDDDTASSSRQFSRKSSAI